ncbi:biliverdin-producing heme oxygenase [Pseudomonas citronellolis]|uniref:biliverdin-producing heme oxygenase n=1 Tax=Pseudomonas citronellolis TaxID=53408 RepID=UPI0023E41DAD|nr:biliverdin-producing heme oxygenase [Pseudomonas citronellolis]MDF3933997.1 biliverdin-producing heme oxygenase [Pseudomonas citronellolis]
MTTLEAPALRSQRLNLVTHQPHQRLDNAVKAHDPFASREHFTPFVVAQYLFQSELQALYQDPALIAIFPDLAERCRAQQAKADLADLGAEVPAAVDGAVANPSRAAALGWLFVSEGSKLGAAFLIKRVAALGLSEDFGARHLGEPAGGRAEGWKRFTRTLDGLELSAADEREAEAGALAAFERFGVLLQHAYEHAAARA